MSSGIGNGGAEGSPLVGENLLGLKAPQKTVQLRPSLTDRS